MQQGGSPYGALPSQPQMQQSSELPSSFQGMAMAEAAPPITSLPPPPPPPLSSSSVPTFEELATGDDPLEGGSGSSGGNRWPRQETLALLKIRSDMDAAFKDATLKGPLWEDVSRKLAELGYKRNAKKCKEKFENVHKYYKRTKEGRAGRQDGKSYRFFSQLEALHSSTVSSSSPRQVPINLNPPPMTTTANTSVGIPRPIQAQNPATSAPMPITSVPPPPPIQLSSVPSPNMISHNVQYPLTAKPGGFSSNSSSSSSGSESDDEQTEDLPMSGKKRKRESESGSRKMMAFFEGLMRQVMERQETMQKKFLEAIEKREQDRMIREEAWRRQEITRMAREHELTAQERAAAASRDAAIISFLQKVTGQTVQVPSPNITVSNQPPPPSQTPPPPPLSSSQIHQQTPPPPPTQQTPPPQQAPPPPQQQQQHHQRSQDIVLHQYQTTPPVNTEMTTMQVMEEGSGGMSGPSTDPTSSRWPKAEVHALIQLRSGLDSRYQETGPKGPLWEEISAGMRRLGYNRNAKRCKEKWENINKYFKKVKESNKQRPEDAKTCPYFHQLDALYRSKHNTSGSGGGGSGLLQLTHPNPNPNPNQNQNPNQNPNPSPISMMAPPQLAGDKDQTNGGARTNFFGQTTTGGGDEGGIMKKPEDIVRELMEQTNNNSEYGNDQESDNMDEDDEDDEDGEDDEEEEGNGQYRIQFQRQNNVSNSNNNGGGNGTPTQNTSGNSTGSFLAMVR